MKPFTIDQLNWVNSEIGRHIRQQAINHERAEEIIKMREAKLARVTLALRDAISTYDDSREITLVSAERQEAWRAALNS